MTAENGCEVFTDEAWAAWEPLIAAVRPHGKTPLRHLRRTISAIFWRHQNGAKWRSVPAELGPWWKAAQTFIRWSKLGVWERLLDLVQRHEVALGMTFLDGTNVRAHHKAAGAEKRGSIARSEMCVRRLVGSGPIALARWEPVAAATAPRPA
jgi:transposase